MTKKQTSPEEIVRNAVKALEEAHFRGSAELEATMDRVMEPYYERQRNLTEEVSQLTVRLAETETMAESLKLENAALRALLKAHGIRQ